MADIPTTKILSLLFRRFTLRHWRSTPRQSLLLLLILSLGIAVFFSIRLANRAAVSSFHNFTELLSRESDWQISAPAGSLPVEVLTELRSLFGDEPIEIVPVVETTAARPRQGNQMEIATRETFQLIGLDLIAIKNISAKTSEKGSHLRSSSRREGNKDLVPTWNPFHTTNAVFISTALAQRDHLKTGDSLSLVINENIIALKIAGIIPAAPGMPQAPATLLVMDLPALQRLINRVGRLDRIEFVVPDGPDREERSTNLRQRLVDASRERWLVSSPVDRRASAEAMTRAFRMNLTILSLIALLVGLYLIFQALDGAVVRRKEEIGILRSLGVTEAAIRRAWLFEAAFLGLAGGLLGAGLGWIGAQFAVRLVGRTVNALYYATSAQAASLEIRELVFAIGLAIVASLIAGWIPSREAAKTPPAQLLVRHSLPAPGHRLWRVEGLGWILIILAVLLVQFPPLRFTGGVRFPLAGYLGGFLLIFGGGLLCGQALRVVAGLSHSLRERSVSIRIALSHLAKPSSRHRLAVAGLLCAISMSAGMIILVGSFDRTMRGWISRTFQSDLYVSSDGAQSASTQNRISPTTWKAIAALPKIAEVNVVQAAGIQIGDARTTLVGGELNYGENRGSIAWLQRPLNHDVFNPALNTNVAFISESFSERFRVRRGDSVTVPTPAGKKQLRIAGVFSDYGNERGSIVVERKHFASWFGDEMASSMILLLKPGVPPESLRTELMARYPGLSIYTNAHLRSEILRIFHQTFSITYALEVIAIIVALAGLGMTLASILLERRAELTTLRALGFGRHEIARATAAEGLMLSICGVAVGLLISFALGWILIYVINHQTFGWTLQFTLPWLELGILSALVISAGTIVSYGVGRWGSNLPADREE